MAYQGLIARVSQLLINHSRKHIALNYCVVYTSFSVETNILQDRDLDLLILLVLLHTRVYVIHYFNTYLDKRRIHLRLFHSSSINTPRKIFFETIIYSWGLVNAQVFIEILQPYIKNTHLIIRGNFFWKNQSSLQCLWMEFRRTFDILKTNNLGAPIVFSGIKIIVYNFRQTIICHTRRTFRYRSCRHLEYIHTRFYICWMHTLSISW